MIPRILRVLAFAIAIAGALDPALLLSARAKPEVAIISSAPGDSALARQVAGTLNGEFTVVPARFAAAAATVLVGKELPPDAAQLSGPVFAVVPTATVEITGIRAPAHASANGRVPVVANVHVTGERGRAVEVTLRAGGVVVDRVTRNVVRDDDVQAIPLELVPATTGVLPYSIAAVVNHAKVGARADGIVEVGEQRWNVLFYDGRPSWQSTFVRRALERDARFVITSRVTTSRAISRAAGQPPQTITPESLDPFDVVVVGAPESLSINDVAGVEGYLRRRAGNVVLLYDKNEAGSIDRLTGIPAWRSESVRSAVAIRRTTSSSDSVRATELLAPARPPAGAHAVARSTRSSSDTLLRTVVWSAPVGAGQVIVSGALDAWQFRDASFDRFWQSLIGEAADGASSELATALGHTLLRPGETTDLMVTLQSAAFADLSAVSSSSASVTAAVESAGQTIPLWPDRAPGSLRGRIRAPARPGTYRVVVQSNGARAVLPFVVAATFNRAEPDQRTAIGAFALSRKGSAVQAAKVDELPGLLSRALRPERRREATHPLRSFWWMFAFTLLLSAEWWIRRRSGLR